MGGRSKRRDIGKEKYWRGVIREGARSGLSIREYCRQKRIKESQFYAWRRELKHRDEEEGRSTAARSTPPKPRVASFALVSTNGEGFGDAGIELVLAGGRRLRIGRGVDEETLRRVVSVLDGARC